MIINLILRYVKNVECRMDIDEVKKRSAKYNLNKNDFTVKIISNFVSSKKFVIFGKDEYFYELTNENNFFPYFCDTQNKDNIEIWLTSINETLEKKNKIIKKI